jgi:raffinose/stachyose/melibiose transport system permease protein
VPRELDESAKIDGCGYIRTFYNIIFPLLKPATATVVILNITTVWNDFMSPLTFITKNSARTLPVGIYMFMNDRAIDYGPIFAFVILSIVLPVITFIAFQRYFYKGIVAGAVKG